MIKKEALIVFVRKPELGKVKTRLAATIGDLAALSIYQKLLQHTFEVTQRSSAQKFIFYAGEKVEGDCWQQPGYTKLVQEETDLGNRMKTAFETVFQEGFEKVVIIGSDCPQLTVKHLEQAFHSLHINDVVIGPATDGGYYLLGMKTLHPALFEEMPWSTASVYTDTVSRIKQLSLTHSALPVLTDVDEEKDLPGEWRKEIA